MGHPLKGAVGALAVMAAAGVGHAGTTVSDFTYTEVNFFEQSWVAIDVSIIRPMFVPFEESDFLATSFVLPSDLSQPAFDIEYVGDKQLRLSFDTSQRVAPGEAVTFTVSVEHPVGAPVNIRRVGIVPAPGALGVMAAAGLALSRRRR